MDRLSIAAIELSVVTGSFPASLGVDSDASGFIANLARWFVRLIALVVAFDALGLPAVSEVLQRLLLWLPNLVVALVVLVIAGLAANALGKLVRGATAQAGFTNPDALATVNKAAIWSFAVVVAVNQLGIAETQRESPTPGLRTVGSVLHHSGPERRVNTGGKYAGMDRRIAA